MAGPSSIAVTSISDRVHQEVSSYPRERSIGIGVCMDEV